VLIWLMVVGPLVAAGPLPHDTLPAEIDLRAVPAGLTARPPDPADNPVTPAKVQLGRRLFFDPLLSRDRTVSCASCHNPDHGFASTDVVAIGIGGHKGRRNAPTLLNVGYGTSFFWDGRAASLEEQALRPIEDADEMGSSVEETLRRLRTDSTYVTQFREAFGGAVSADHLAGALASFQRALVSGDSAIDRFHASNFKALTDGERQGLWLFESRGNCWRCHSGPNLTDGRFHNTGVSWGAIPGDAGRFETTRQEADRGAFKTPTLRDVARTAPYMHDGSMATLEDVVRYYSRGGNSNPHLDRHLKPLNLSDDEVRHLVAFLTALNGNTGAFPK
jgi:cytochrome c peroxidase